MSKYSVTKPVIILVCLSLTLFGLLLWLTYFNPIQIVASHPLINLLPSVIAGMNFAATIAICAGIVFIKNGYRRQHIISMATALGCSALFLVAYLAHHSIAGDTLFLGVGAIRYVYFTILISHIIMTLFVLPTILITVYFALRNQFQLHKKIARWTWPIWLYVSVTGVLIYLIQKSV